MNTLTYGSLFTGIGGIDLGLDRAGMECKWQVEIDPKCRLLLSHYWPTVPKYADIHEVTEVEYVDVIAGGFPCQPISNAGKQKGDKDPRWLWPEYRRVVDRVRPAYVLVENVPRLLTIDRGRLFGGILADLAALGYDAEWHCLPAAAFGTPQLRWRLFLVAYTSGIGSSGWGDTGDVAASTGEDKGGEEERERDGDTVDDSFSNVGRYPFPPGPDTVDEWKSILSVYPDIAPAVETQPQVRRVANGVPSRMDRLRQLGNAVVPAIAEYIGRGIIEHHNTQSPSPFSRAALP